MQWRLPRSLPAVYIKSFCQAGNPALLHYSYSAMETGESEVPTTTLKTCKEGGERLSAPLTSAVTSAFPAAVIIKLNTGITNETVQVCGGAVALRFVRVNGCLHVCAWNRACMCELNLPFTCVRKITFCLMLFSYSCPSGITFMQYVH